MFPYQDPTETNFLIKPGALAAYRSKLDIRYQKAAQEPGTQFITLQRLNQLKPNVQIQVATIPWNAFPRKRTAVSPKQIDGDRLTLQEEYIEWRTEFDSQKRLTQVTFTTEFPECWQALADVSVEALIAGIKSVIPGANPTVQELLGTAQSPPALGVDGVVGPATWTVLDRVVDHGAEPEFLQPVLRLGARGDSVRRLQQRLQWLDLLKTADGDFGPITQTAVINFQKTYRGAGQLFRQNLANNPWNNGRKGILCLTQQFNTLLFLFNLVSQCSVPQRQLRPQEVCRLGRVNSGRVDCVPERSSDPNVCAAAQNQAIQGNFLSLEDPTRLRLLEMQGIWALNGNRIDINNPDRNSGVWTVSRGGQRGILRNQPGLTLEGMAITSGAQVAQKLQLGANVIIARETNR